MKTKIFFSVSLILFGVGAILAYGFRLNQESDAREPASTSIQAPAQIPQPVANKTQ